ncbi:MAG: TonB-dependent receptor [Prevotella sp.]|nr:TonB-dependent receptor [Prevotella sp.]
MDFVGKDIFTGTVKHTFQVGFDYKKNDLKQLSYSGLYGLKPGDTKTEHSLNYIDIIDVTQSITNTFPQEYATISFKNKTETPSRSSSYGIMLQEVMTINDYVKTILGLRYSYGSSSDNTSTQETTGDAWNPMVGLMITPIKNINLFGSYTTTTSLRSAANKKEDGSEIGPSNTKQWEFGVKSDWLNNRLRFNFTYFKIKNANLSHKAYDDAGVEQTFYEIAGDLLRDGVEVELSGRILPNLQVMLGYAYLDARYQNSPVYENGSAPMNAPEHTANGWIYYTLDRSVLKGLSFGIGTYYVGKRPINDYSLSPDGHGSMTGKKPFDMPAYTTVNAQLAYTYNKVTARVFFNNIFDEIGYNSYYRGGYINQIDPRNFATTLSYQF